MRNSSSRRWLPAILALTFLLTLATACENPFDPLDESATIEGLTYFNWDGGWAQWDSDVEYDGFVISFSYYNEFGEGIDFVNKPHTVRVEFYRPDPADEDSFLLPRIFGRDFTVRNSDDELRIPKELYASKLAVAGFDLAESVNVFIVVDVFPPRGRPQTKLTVGAPNQNVWVPAEGLIPNP